MAIDMPAQFDPKAAERRWYPQWVDRGYFHDEPGERGEPYCLVLPPPNVTGRLHIGHALDHTIQDILTRRARMQGKTTLWLPGTDHAGIATQVVVERALREEGVDRHDLGREKFVERVWAWKGQYGGEIVEQMKALGNSCDWDRLRFTMDEGLSRAVRAAFVQLYQDGLIYRGERLVNWCPKDRTGLSDSEVEHEDVAGELVTFQYPLSDGSGHVAVATTRLETMLGDTGIAVNPKDERYADLVAAGATVKHPFDGRELPIVADDHVDRAFGTGAVKVTPAHDPNDWDIAERTGLPRINILNADASLNDAVPKEFRGLDRYSARARVRQRLSELGLLVDEVRPYAHSVGHCYRCKSEIEPWISGLQWFVKVEPLKEAAREAVRDGRIGFTPPRWANAYDTWMEGLRDWNISRQLWWGHRIPVWYCPNDHTTVAAEDPSACAECGSADLAQDPDVLDTWFSSQLWPFSTLGWPDTDNPDFRFFYPTSVLVTGYEILYLWVARMIMSGLRLADDVPFRRVVIHGLVRDAHGKKMSKSLGNVIDPLDMIDRYGADALRFALARMASPEQQNLPLSEEAIEAGRNFANKVWNAARFVLSFEGKPELPAEDSLEATERWLLGRHQACVREVNDALDRDEYAEAATALYRFVWSEFCDWGLEMQKDRLYDGTAEKKQTAANVLAWILERTMRLIHPVMPFVTEEIWQRLGDGESIVIAEWPGAATYAGHEQTLGAEGQMAFPFFEGLVSAIRRFRGDHGISPKAPMQLRVVARDPMLKATLGIFGAELRRLGGIDDVSFVDGADRSGCLALLVQGETILVPVGDLIDVSKELGAAGKRLATARQDAEKANRKLGNPTFREKAAADVVLAQELKLGVAEREIASLEQEIAELERLAGS